LEILVLRHELAILRPTGLAAEAGTSGADRALLVSLSRSLHQTAWVLPGDCDAPNRRGARGR
jgi:hypothetical protein